MERINKYIYLVANKDKEISETACIVRQDQDNIYLVYSLLDNDCLFDFSDICNKIEIVVAKAYFEKYDQNFKVQLAKQDICCNTQSKLFELVNCKLKGVVRNIYLESIVLNLLIQTQKNNAAFQKNCNSCGFLTNSIEADKIQKAKDFIIRNLDQNITIPTIAGYVGTNQCYLKKRFKEIQGQTIFEFLRENRMIKARHLLQNSNYSIQEISVMVGYSSISSFSQAYKNYFGLSPRIDQKFTISIN